MNAASRWVAVFFIVFNLTASALAVESDSFAPDYPVVTEIQTASVDDASEEFVEIYNPTDSPVDVEGWELQYKSATGENWIAKAALTGSIEPRGYLLLATEGYLEDLEGQVMGSGVASSGGHIQIIVLAENREETILDRVGWGSADSPEGVAAEAPVAGESLKRVVDVETAKYIDGDDNSQDFSISSEPDPEHTLSPESEEDEQREENPDDNPVVEYLQIHLSELLVDPDTPLSDADDEFVELYNPNQEAVNLAGYVVETGSSFNYDFLLPEIIMQPQQYLALYAQDTSLVLSNSGGAARILDPNGEEIDTTTYDAMKPDDSWSRFEASWKVSLKSTPNAPNELVLENSESQSSSVTTTLKPCASNQYRNPSTNRCRLISTGSSLKPCAADEFRNPETNRCKKNTSATTASPTANDNSQEVLAATSEQKVSKPDFTAVALVGGAALLYSLYEFRYDIRNRFHQSRGYFTDRFFRRKSP